MSKRKLIFEFVLYQHVLIVCVYILIKHMDLQSPNIGITFSVSSSVLKFEFPCAQYRYQQQMSSLWENGLQGELVDLRLGKPAQNESKIVGFAHKIFKDCCVKRGRVISDGRNGLVAQPSLGVAQLCLGVAQPCLGVAF